MSVSPQSEHDDLFDDEPVGNGPEPNGEGGVKAEERKDADLDDLFGDDEANSPPPARAASSAPTTPEPGPAGRDRSPSRSGTPRDPLEYAEEDYADEPVAEEVMADLVPPIKRMVSADDKLWHLKLPSFVAVEPTPYNPDGFHKSATAKAESQDADDDKKLAAAKFLLAKNTIRWQWVDGPDGKRIRKSNARFVRWSDGSFSLQLGSDLFDVNASIAPSSDPSPSTSANGTAPFPTFSTSESSKASAASRNKTTVNPDTLPITYIAHKAETDRMVNVLSVQAPITGTLSLLPTSMSSKTHMELVSHIERQHARQSKLKILDHEQDRELMMRSEVGAEIKARMKARPVQRTGSGGGFGGAKAGRGQGKKKAYDSDDSDGYTGPGYGRRGAQRPAGSGRVGRPIGVDAGDYDEDDGFVVADSDSEASASGSGGDSDAYGGSKRKSKKSKSRKRDYSPDLIEDADRLIEAASREKREQKRARRDAEGGKSRSERKEKRRAEKERKRSTRDYESGSDEEAEEEAKMTDEGEMDMDMDMETEEE